MNQPQGPNKDKRTKRLPQNKGAGGKGQWFPYAFSVVVGLSIVGLIGAQFEPPVTSKILTDWKQTQAYSDDRMKNPASTAEIKSNGSVKGKPSTYKLSDNKKPPKKKVEKQAVKKETPVPWPQFAVKAPSLKGRIPIIIVIDDMGMSMDYTDQFAALKGPLTYAFLPYAGNLDQQTKTIKAMGHELLLHLPMESTRNGTNPGENALLRDLPYEETMRRIDWNLKQFSGYVGVNNHMGSQYTASRSFMFPVLSEIKARDLLFLDSKTASNSVASDLSAELQIPTISRDIFLDNVRTIEAILLQLNTLENIARRKGIAIAIGHPYRVTLQALKAWIPTLEQKGFVLWPLSAALLEKHQLKASK